MSSLQLARAEARWCKGVMAGKNKNKNETNKRKKYKDIEENGGEGREKCADRNNCITASRDARNKGKSCLRESSVKGKVFPRHRSHVNNYSGLALETFSGNQ